MHAIEFYTKEILGFKLHLDTLLYSWGLILFLIFLSWLASKKFKIIPLGFQGVFEIIYDYLNNLAEGMIGKDSKEYIPLVMTIFLFVLVSNWLGLIPGFIPPTRDINTTLALAIVSFLSFNYFGIKSSYLILAHHQGKPKGLKNFLIFIIKGFWKWFSHFFQPTPALWNSLEGVLKYLMVPFLCLLFFILNIIEEFARVISLSIRLMGNIMGEHLAVSILLGLLFMVAKLDFVSAVTTPIIWASSAFVMIIGALTGFIQALIFAVLTLSYIAHAVAEEH
ncbi:MAG: F0F1 ATP synthase subunit A [Armatimonadetes bacterium]|nr:F0F1 ATP synthase subunit A [Armatimonadota bacterium]